MGLHTGGCSGRRAMNSIRLASLVTRARPLGHCLVLIGSNGGAQMTDRQPSDPTFIKLVRTAGLLDELEGAA